jgi:hypothetical protein
MPRRNAKKPFIVDISTNICGGLNSTLLDKDRLEVTRNGD